MKTTRKILISILAVSLSLATLPSYGATAKKKAATKKGKPKKETSKQVKKQLKMTPSESFYDKMWEKYKLGSKNDKADVIKTLRKIAKENPNEYMSYYYLGIMANEEGQPNQALRYFDLALLGFPKSADIHIRIAKILGEKGGSKEAGEHYTKALELDNTNPKALSKVGILELENKNYAKAQEYLVKARELEPDNSSTLRALGEVWLYQGNYYNAIQILEQVLLFDKQDANAHLLLGKAYEKSGNHHKAAEHIELAGKFAKKDASIVEAIGYDIARNLSKSGKLEEAISAYKKEIKKNSDPAQGFYEMGEVYERLDDSANAIKAYQKAYELNKKMTQGIFRCAELYHKNRDKENMEKMVRLLKNSSELKERALDMLEDLKKEEELTAEREIQYKLSGSGTKDAGLEAAYLEIYASNKKDSANLEKLYLYYRERGYYDEALTWFRRYAKAGSVTDYEKKSIENELKGHLEQDNYYLFGDKKSDSPGKSKVPDDELLNLAFNGENDRLKEVSLQILLSRKEHKEERRVIEAMLRFYEERGRVKEASKYIGQMKRLGYLTDAEARERKSRLK